MLQDVKECEKSLDSGHGSMEEISHSEVSINIFILRDNLLCVTTSYLDLSSFKIAYPLFLVIGLPHEMAYKIKSLFSVHALMVLKFLSCLAKYKRKYNVSACFLKLLIILKIVMNADSEFLIIMPLR